MVMTQGEPSFVPQYYPQAAPRAKPDTSNLQIMGILGAVIGLALIALGSYVHVAWMIMGAVVTAVGGMAMVAHMSLQAWAKAK